MEDSSKGCIVIEWPAHWVAVWPYIDFEVLDNLDIMDTFAYYVRQGGITFEAIDKPRKSSYAIDERVIIIFRDKNVYR